jgi:hypothetical protein
MARVGCWARDQSGGCSGLFVVFAAVTIPEQRKANEAASSEKAGAGSYYYAHSITLLLRSSSCATAHSQRRPPAMAPIKALVDRFSVLGRLYERFKGGKSRSIGLHFPEAVRPPAQRTTNS